MPYSLLNPLLKSALVGLDLDLEQELKRYRGEDLPTQLPVQLAESTLDSDLDFDVDFDIPRSVSSEISEWDDQSSDLSYLDHDFPNDFSSALSTDLENTLEEEFLDLEFRDQLLATELVEVSPDQNKLKYDQQNSRNSEQSAPNLLSPLGIAAMILLLISSATVGYLLVDPSGLNKLLRKDPKPTSSLQNLELFQTNSTNRVEQVPFVDFSTIKPQEKTREFPRGLPLMLPLIGTGRSFEAPVRTELEQSRKDAIIVEPVVASKTEKPKLSSPPKTDRNSNLKLEQSLPAIAITNNSLPNNLPPSPVINLKEDIRREDVKQVKSPISPNQVMPIQVNPKSVAESNPVMVLDATKPRPTAVP